MHEHHEGIRHRLVLLLQLTGPREQVGFVIRTPTDQKHRLTSGATKTDWLAAQTLCDTSTFQKAPMSLHEKLSIMYSLLRLLTAKYAVHVS
jgi:hypothetical protein